MKIRNNCKFNSFDIHSLQLPYQQYNPDMSIKTFNDLEQVGDTYEIIPPELTIELEDNEMILVVSDFHAEGNHKITQEIVEKITKQVIELAGKGIKVKYFIFAGDTIETTIRNWNLSISRITSGKPVYLDDKEIFERRIKESNILSIIDRLKILGIKIIILPGNHDYLPVEWSNWTNQQLIQLTKTVKVCAKNQKIAEITHLNNLLPGINDKFREKEVEQLLFLIPLFIKASLKVKQMLVSYINSKIHSQEESGLFMELLFKHFPQLKEILLKLTNTKLATHQMQDYLEAIMLLSKEDQDFALIGGHLHIYSTPQTNKALFEILDSNQDLTKEEMEWLIKHLYLTPSLNGNLGFIEISPAGKHEIIWCDLEG